jgi:hypothetical protein
MAAPLRLLNHIRTPALLRPPSRLDQSTAQGFVLPTTLVAAAILLVGCIGLAMVGAATQAGSARQYQSRLAQDVAEAGVTVTLDKLNSTYRYLLVRDLNEWSSATLYPTRICPGASTNVSAMPTSGIIQDSGNDSIGTYVVSSYDFNGSTYYGGTGTLKVRGEISNAAGAVVASSIITTRIQVVPKNCGGRITTPPTTSGFPGLIANTINLGGNDVTGQINGNILCLSCTGTSQAQLSEQIGQGTQSVVNGTLFAGSIPLPPIPQPPSTLSNNGVTVSESTTFTAGQSNGGACVVDNGITYCRIARVTLHDTQRLEFDTSSGPIWVYFDGDLTLSGQAVIAHGGSPQNLVFFGLPADQNPGYRQTFVISGGSSAVNAFVYMPDACVGINGGSTSPDLRGGIWSNHYGGGGSGGCGSSSNNGDIQIPDDMGGLLTDSLGDDFNVSIRDFAGAGTTAWSTSTSQ